MNHDKYKTIINCPRWEPNFMTSKGKLKHKRMTLENRSAIFAPFSALSGFEDAIKKTEKMKNTAFPFSENESNVL